MTKYTDILKAIIDKIKTEFPDISIVSEGDVEEKIVRPSFLVSLDNMKASDFMYDSLDREMTVRIIYFPENRYINKIEILDMIDSLNDLFIQDGSIEVSDDCTIELYGENEIDIVDKVLHYEIDIVINDDYERDDSDVENMEDIEIEI